jgi:hypothetical protein
MPTETEDSSPLKLATGFWVRPLAAEKPLLDQKPGLHLRLRVRDKEIFNQQDLEREALTIGGLVDFLLSPHAKKRVWKRYLDRSIAIGGYTWYVSLQEKLGTYVIRLSVTTE